MPYLNASRSSWFGEATGPVLRHFECPAVDHTEVEKALRVSIPIPELRAAVQRALDLAVSLLNSAAPKLQISPRDASVRDLFRRCFGTTPEFVPAWKPASAKWVDRGDLVAIRLWAASKILAGGFIRFFCWGRQTHCSECSDSPPTYFACSSWGKQYVICLGSSFWTTPDGVDLNLNRAATLIHEAMHIYFGRLVGHGEKGRYGDANCYVRFALEVNGKPIPGRVRTRCGDAP